jgi:hypothetical protein
MRHSEASEERETTASDGDRRSKGVARSTPHAHPCAWELAGLADCRGGLPEFSTCAANRRGTREAWPAAERGGLPVARNAGLLQNSRTTTPCGFLRRCCLELHERLRVIWKLWDCGEFAGTTASASHVFQSNWAIYCVKLSRPRKLRNFRSAQSAREETTASPSFLLRERPAENPLAHRVGLP